MGGSALGSPGVSRDGKNDISHNLSTPGTRIGQGVPPDQAKGSGESRGYSPKEGKKGERGITPGPASILKIFYYLRRLLFYTFVQNKHKSNTFLIRTPSTDVHSGFAGLHWLPHGCGHACREPLDKRQE